MKKWFSLLIALVMMLGMVPAMAEESPDTTLLVGDGANTVTVTFNGESVPRDVLIPALEAFYEETGISTQIIYVTYTGGWGGYIQKLQTMIVGGTVPDLCRSAIEGYELFKSNGMAAPLNEYIEKYPEWHAMIDSHPNLNTAFTTDGVTYGYSFDWNPILVHLNTNILAEKNLEMPDENWTRVEFLEYAKAMTYVREDGTEVYGLQMPSTYFQINGWLYAHGASVLNEDWTECTINSPEAIEAVQFLYDLLHVYKVGTTGGSFFNDQFGMYLSGRWTFNTYANNNFDAVDLQYLPLVGDNPHKIAVGSATFLITSQSEKKDEAYKLYCWLCAPERQATLFSVRATPSANSVLEEVSAAEKPANSYLWKAAADNGVFMQVTDTYPEMSSIISSYLSAIYADEMSVEDALNECADEINMLLAGF